jgi:hypothetical protein
MSSSKRDADQNSEYDRYEARLNKKDEALALQNKVSAEQTVLKIDALYGPFSDNEIEHYRRKLTRDGAPVINDFQSQLIGYMYYKDLGDPITMSAIHNQTDYIKLMIASKRILKNSGMVILPYIISSRVLRIATRKIISKKDIVAMEADPLYEQIKNKYNNPKIIQKIYEFIGAVISSSFEIIDYDDEIGGPTEWDGKQVPMINDIVKQELMFFITSI